MDSLLLPFSRKFIRVSGIWNYRKRKVTTWVHVIIALAFHGQPPIGKEIVDHLDSCKRNCQPDNLEWVSMQTNIERAKKPCQSLSRTFGTGAQYTFRSITKVADAFKLGQMSIKRYIEIRELLMVTSFCLRIKRRYWMMSMQRNFRISRISGYG
jgi:hypothetical protein